METIIFHVDVNSAFLSWSAVKRLKEDSEAVDLRTIPSAVGGDVETRHGIITAKSIPAKKFGIKTGEPVVKALQKCPSLVLVKSDFTTYREYSRAFIRILREYSSVVEQVSIDEAYMDMSEGKTLVSFDHENISSILNIAGRLKDAIRERLGFTVNVGVSVNRILAKMASDFEKPDKVHTLLPEEVPSKMWPLPIGELHGCGRQTAAKLSRLGIRTIGEAAGTPLSLLQSYLGEKAGEYIFLRCNGIGSDVLQTEAEEAKSYSNETTTAFDIDRNNYDKAVPEILSHLCRKVSERLLKDGVFASTIGVMVKTDQFQRHSRQKTLERSVNDFESLYRHSKELLSGLTREKDGLFDRGYALRLIGVSASSLDKGEFRQMDLFDYLSAAPSPPDVPGPAADSSPVGSRPRPQDTLSADTNTKIKKKPPRTRSGKAENIKHSREKTETEKRLNEMVEKIRRSYGVDSIHKGFS
ncbi:MAG: DNA polymerase IV [Blautia sp.]|nr:DNA polymerase IV [Blautia sp.]